jgi:hypothetical protein
MVQLSFADVEAPRVDGEDRPPTSTPTRDRRPDDDDASPSALAREFTARDSVANEVAQLATPSAQPATAAAPIGSPTVPAASLQSFIASLKLPLEEPLIASSPRCRVSRLDDSAFVPRCSDRLAAKSIYRDPNLEKQVKRVLLNKWRHEPVNGSQTPDPAIAAKFHKTFAGPLSASKKAATKAQRLE